MKTTDIRRPPRQSGDAHVKARGQLVAEAGPGRGNVAAPDEGAVLLAAGPGAADQVDDVLLALGLHALVKGAGVLPRVEVADAEHGAEVVAVVVKVVDGVFGLGLVEPEELDSFGVVVFLDLVPDVLAGVGVERVVVGGVALEVVVDPDAPFGLYQVSTFPHLFKVLGAGVDGRPDGNHELDLELMELLDHGVFTQQQQTR